MKYNHVSLLIILFCGKMWKRNHPNREKRGLDYLLSLLSLLISLSVVIKIASVITFCLSTEERSCFSAYYPLLWRKVWVTQTEKEEDYPNREDRGLEYPYSNCFSLSLFSFSVEKGLGYPNR